MDNDLDLSALRAFRSVAREGSFAAAARVLRAPKSTVSKRVQDLEAQLRVRLIERTTRQLRLTAAGVVLAARAERLLGEADEIRRIITDSGSAPRGHLRIAVPQIFGQMLMGGIAARFRARYPDITLECLFLDRPADLLEEDLDGMLRVGPEPAAGEPARVMGLAPVVPVVAPGWPDLARLGSPADLMSVPVVGYAPAPGYPWTFRRGAETVEIRTEPALALGSSLAIRDAVLAGAGLALLPWFAVRDEIAAGRLVRALPDWESSCKTISFVWPSPHSATARLRAFVDHLAEELGREPELWQAAPRPTAA